MPTTSQRPPLPENIKLEDIREDITRQVRAALEEDIGSGDVTAELIDADATSDAYIITKEDCTICGTAWVDETFSQLGGLKRTTWHVKDGDKVTAGTRLVDFAGNSRRLLTGERTALNFLQLLSGVATKSAEYADLVKDEDVKILDTRKTIPGLRTAQKYAVAVGGCYNHRIGLFDRFLIKENHIAACGGIEQAVLQARSQRPNLLVEVEVETIVEFEQALLSGADIIMLDEFNEAMSRIVRSKLDQKVEPRPFIEISGNVNIHNLFVSEVEDFISVGALTKHVKAVDLSFRLSEGMKSLSIT